MNKFVQFKCVNCKKKFKWFYRYQRKGIYYFDDIPTCLDCGSHKVKLIIPALISLDNQSDTVIITANEKQTDNRQVRG